MARAANQRRGTAAVPMVVVTRGLAPATRRGRIQHHGGQAAGGTNVCGGERGKHVVGANDQKDEPTARTGCGIPTKTQTRGCGTRWKIDCVSRGHGYGIDCLFLIRLRGTQRRLLLLHGHGLLEVYSGDGEEEKSTTCCAMASRKKKRSQGL